MFFEVTGGPLGRIWRAPRGSRRHSWTLPTTFPLVVGLYTTLAWMKRDQTQHVSDVDDTLPSQHRILGVGHFKRAQVDHSSLAPKILDQTTLGGRTPRMHGTAQGCEVAIFTEARAPTRTATPSSSMPHTSTSSTGRRSQRASYASSIYRFAPPESANRVSRAVRSDQMVKEMKGVCLLFSETGTEGGWWGDAGRRLWHRGWATGIGRSTMRATLCVNDLLEASHEADQQQRVHAGTGRLPRYARPQ